MFTHGFLCSPDDTVFLGAELQTYALDSKVIGPGFLSFEIATTTTLPDPVFQRQFLPQWVAANAPSIRKWAELAANRIRADCPPDQPWRLHTQSRYQTLQSSHAGEHRCALIRAAILEILAKSSRQFRRRLVESTKPFQANEALVQLILTEPEIGGLSVAAPPLFSPIELHRRVSPFPAGEIPVASDPTAPSRAFAKLVEAELRLGQRLAPGETCVDLGACPGSWSYVALARGASVVAVDRSPVRADLLRHPQLRFHEGDAFQYAPPERVDWLICDVIAAPERSLQLTLDWARQRWCRNFIVTLKFKGHDDYSVLERLKQELPAFSTDFGLRRLCANRNEACVFGTVR